MCLPVLKLHGETACPKTWWLSMFSSMCSQKVEHLVLTPPPLPPLLILDMGDHMHDGICNHWLVG